MLPYTTSAEVVKICQEVASQRQSEGFKLDERLLQFIAGVQVESADVEAMNVYLKPLSDDADYAHLATTGYSEYTRVYANREDMEQGTHAISENEHFWWLFGNGTCTVMSMLNPDLVDYADTWGYKVSDLLKYLNHETDELQGYALRLMIVYDAETGDGHIESAACPLIM